MPLKQTPRVLAISVAWRGFLVVFSPPWRWRRLGNAPSRQRGVGALLWADVAPPPEQEQALHAKRSPGDIGYSTAQHRKSSI